MYNRGMFTTDYVSATVYDRTFAQGVRTKHIDNAWVFEKQDPFTRNLGKCVIQDPLPATSLPKTTDM